jgi:uncharacterized protein YyaL (SSP411 family)
MKAILMNATLKPIVSFSRVALRDCRPRPLGRTAKLESHLLAAEAWLCRAQDASSDGGVSYGYSLRGGWRPSYPETSGYIATTFFRLARDRNAPVYAERAHRILSWLLSVQNADGSFSNPRYGKQGIVFDTGQVLFGLIKGYELTEDLELLASARRAASWLTQIVDTNLQWTKNEHLNTPHVYNTRTAWALLRMNEIEFAPAREAVARANLDWAVGEQLESGFFNHCSFKRGEAPFTHTLAYTAQGLLESGTLLNDRKYEEAAIRCADAALLHLRDDGYLPSSIWPAGQSHLSSCCLTGNCQFALVWAKLYARHGGEFYRLGALRALEYVMSTQDISTTDPNVRGGIKGSNPVWGCYASMSFPNWATKFFVDAMWLRKDMDKCDSAFAS